MLNNLKPDTLGRAQIINMDSWMDGGTMDVYFATLNNEELKISVNQHWNLRIDKRNPFPGRLMLNDDPVAVRSALESEIIGILKQAVFVKAGRYEEAILKEKIEYLESVQYIEIARLTGG